METSFYISAAGGEATGPYALSQLRTMWQSGAITSDTLAYREDLQQWVAVSSLLTPPVPPATLQKPKRKSIGFGAAILIFILLVIVMSVVLPSVESPEIKQQRQAAEAARNQNLKETAELAASNKAAYAEQVKKDIATGKIWVGMTKREFKSGPYGMDEDMRPEKITKSELGNHVVETWKWKSQSVVFVDGVITQIHDY